MTQPDTVGEQIPVGILVVDDHRENRLALSSILSSPDYRVVEAESGREALKKLLEEEFAVLLVDVLMPEMNGFELAGAIKERDLTSQVPILFLTALATDVALVYKGYQAGAVDYLVKPLVPEMVRAKVAVFAELYRRRKRIEAQAARLVEAERKERDLRLVELQLAGERRYRMLAEAVPHIVWTARTDGSVDYFNQHWFAYTGICVEDAAGSWECAVHPQDRPRCQEQWADALRGGGMLQLECRLRRGRDGRFRWHLCRAVPEQSTTGHVLSWLGTFTDIEDQKRAQSVLAEFKGTLDAVLDAVLIFDPDDWHLLYVNDGASLLLGYSRDELRQMRPTDFLVDRDEVGFREVLASLREGVRTTIALEVQIRRRDTRTIPVELSLQFIEIDGGRIVSIARDITGRKHAERERELLYREAVEAIQARDDFLSIASHELRTPLSSLRLQIEMLLRSRGGGAKDCMIVRSPEEGRAKLEKAAKQVERLSTLLDELMDVSKMRDGRLRLDLEEVDLADVARDVLHRLADPTGRLHTLVRLRAPAAVVGKWDRFRLEQVVTNLVTNAIKFGGGKPVELCVEEEGSRGRLVVRDRGIGIADEDIERIFKRYEQAISSRAYGGLGLGLYIAREIVEAHGGTIHAESQAGEGSTFTVALPREPPSHDDATPSELTDAREPPSRDLPNT
jgi:PAS domain S-box-containing protein